MLLLRKFQTHYFRYVHLTYTFSFSSNRKIIRYLNLIYIFYTITYTRYSVNYDLIVFVKSIILLMYTYIYFINIILTSFWYRAYYACIIQGKIVLVGLSFSALLPKCKYDLTAKWKGLIHRKNNTTSSNWEQFYIEQFDLNFNRTIL